MVHSKSFEIFMFDEEQSDFIRKIFIKNTKKIKRYFKVKYISIVKSRNLKNIYPAFEVTDKDSNLYIVHMTHKISIWSDFLIPEYILNITGYKSDNETYDFFSTMQKINKEYKNCFYELYNHYLYEKTLTEPDKYGICIQEFYLPNKHYRVNDKHYYIFIYEKTDISKLSFKEEKLVNSNSNSNS